jgi:hypothetical protein
MELSLFLSVPPPNPKTHPAAHATNPPPNISATGHPLSRFELEVEGEMQDCDGTRLSMPRTRGRVNKRVARIRAYDQASGLGLKEGRVYIHTYNRSWWADMR